VIKIHIQPDDRYMLRFAFSPSYELIASFRILQEPSRYALHTPWVNTTKKTLANTDLSLMYALIPVHTYIPDFITPLPNTPTPSFDDEIEAMLATPTDVIKHDLQKLLDAYPDRAALIKPCLAHPRATVEKLAKVMQVYWRKTLQSHWPRIRTILEGDLLARSRTLALHGPEQVLDNLHPMIRYDKGTLLIDKLWDRELSTGGEGLLLVPSVFVAPKILLYIDTPPTPAVIYTARGVANLWLNEGSRAGIRGDSASTTGLRELLGNTRADLLVALVTPMTTAQLAEHVGFTQGAVSQHIGALKRAGVVETHRQGKLAFHQLTPAGEALVRIFE